MRRLRAALGSVVIAFLVSVVGCDTPTDVVPPADVSLSDPVSAAEMVSARGRGGTSSDGSAQSGPSYFYISLAPGNSNAGVRAVVRNLSTDLALSTRIVNGGFDPVAILGSPGDLIQIVIKRADDTIEATFSREVPRRTPPRIVRTFPHRKRPDVPLNQSIAVVFSEPIDPSTVTSSTVRLFAGATPIEGVVTVLPGNGAVIAFTPRSLLAPGTRHRVEIGRGIRDLQGEPLATGMTVYFETGASLLGDVSHVRVSPDSVTVNSATYALSATVLDAAGNMLVDRTVSWSSSDAEGMSVSPSGVVTGHHDGWYEIFAEADGIRGRAAVEFRSPDRPASMTMTGPDDPRLIAEDTLHLWAEVRDSHGRLLLVWPTWTSSSPAVAIVQPTGVNLSSRRFEARVIGVAAGTAIITASSESASASVEIVVNPPRPVASVRLSPRSATLALGATSKLGVDVRDAQGRLLTGRPIQWTAGDGSVATVDPTGLVTAIGAGSTTISAMVEGIGDEIPLSIHVVPALTELDAGSLHACALDAEGRVYCWGQVGGWTGQGWRALLQTSGPALLDTETRFTTLSSAGGYSCGLDAGGLTWCWGITDPNDAVAVGDATWTPRAVAGVPPFVLITTGLRHRCGLTASGEAWCWGRNEQGQLGDGTLAGSPTAARVTGGHRFAYLSAGGTTTCGVTVDGVGYCWGLNVAGILGNGSLVDLSTFPVAVAGSVSWKSITVGIMSACGITTGGAAYCWGDNQYGKLGTGQDRRALSLSRVPLSVTGGFSFSRIVLSEMHACGISSSGTARCWGNGGQGQLGDGYTGNDLVAHVLSAPTAVAGSLWFIDITVGPSFSCAVQRTGHAYCWGYEGNGALGIGSANPFFHNAPERIAGQR